MEIQEKFQAWNKNYKSKTISYIRFSIRTGLIHHLRQSGADKKKPVVRQLLSPDWFLFASHMPAVQVAAHPHPVTVIVTIIGKIQTTHFQVRASIYTESFLYMISLWN